MNDDKYCDECVEVSLNHLLSVSSSKVFADKLQLSADTGNKKAKNVISAFRNPKAEYAYEMKLKKLQVLEILRNYVRNPSGTPELVIQRHIERNPWLADPRWELLQSNATLHNFRNAFQNWCNQKNNTKIIASNIMHGTSRPDFIMIRPNNNIEIFEIKKPGHALDMMDLDRLYNYFVAMKEFTDANKVLAKPYSGFHITLICDKVNIADNRYAIYQSLIDKGILHQITWEDLLAGAMHANDIS